MRRKKLKIFAEEIVGADEWIGNSARGSIQFRTKGRLVQIKPPQLKSLLLQFQSRPNLYAAVEIRETLRLKSLSRSHDEDDTCTVDAKRGDHFLQDHTGVGGILVKATAISQVMESECLDQPGKSHEQPPDK
jgi:hypothetical protein